MKNNILIIISGPPCTGKTTLGKKIASEFHIPLIIKDDIKESLFDTLGIKDRECSKKLGVASYSILYNIVESILKANQPLIVESNFKPEFDDKKFLDLKEKYKFKPLQIMCETDGKTLLERFKNRSESGNRHPGHCDNKNYDEFKEVLLKGKHTALNIGGKIITVDTTNFEKVDYNLIFSKVNSTLKT
jgi:adenylate kinase family enzyme